MKNKPGNMIVSEMVCQNIAPIDNLVKSIDTRALKIGVFANNGSGKTYLSRLFRLTERNEEIKINDDGVSSTDKFLSFGRKSGKFSYKITDKNNNVVENFQILLKRGEVPAIPETHYIYHTFNQDYVEDNIQNVGYEKNGEIEGYIIGKINIDLKEDEKELQNILDEGMSLKEQVSKNIDSYIKSNIDKIRDIRRISDYSILNAETIINGNKNDLKKVAKNIDELLEDYNKIKSIPENLMDIHLLNDIDIDFERIQAIQDDLIKEFSLSSLAIDFKQKIKDKQNFIEEGVKLYNSLDGKGCPFCEQELDDSATDLIDRYIEYLNDTESKTIKVLNEHILFLNNVISILKSIEVNSLKQTSSFNDYKSKYIPSSENVELDPIVIKELQSNIEDLLFLIETKLNSINKPVLVEPNALNKIQHQQELLNISIKNNNIHVSELNNKKNKISHESLSVRRDICKAAFNHLKETYSSDIEKVKKLRKDWVDLSSIIEKKREKHKVKKKKKVATVIRKVLDYFFSGKYTLNEESFSLIFNENTLEKGQTKNVLSQGEKNIVAFAYYIGDTYLKVKNEKDLEKLFFIIDDPISSMDYTHVYTLCGVIRNIGAIISELGQIRFILFTHNSDFMRILGSNKIVDTMLLLNKGEVKEFDNNFTVPYICHLLDVFNVARNKHKPNHTTANSIRHIIETLCKFQNLDTSRDGVKNYIEENFDTSTNSYSMIQDLCHGGFRSEQLPVNEDDFVGLCETIIVHINNKFKGQIDYCKKTSA